MDRSDTKALELGLRASTHPYLALVVQLRFLTARVNVGVT